jgi:hypothetical protein
MSAPPPSYDFFTDLARIINSGQSRSVLVTGNVHDLFLRSAEKPARDGAAGAAGEYVPLIQFLCAKSSVKGLSLLIYELNGPIRMLAEDDHKAVKDAWIAWKMSAEPGEAILHALADRQKEKEREVLAAEFEKNLREAIGKPTLALEFLRQLTICSRSKSPGGRPYLSRSLLIIIEAADFLLPAGDGDISKLAQADRHKIGVVQDWFSDPSFMAGGDSVVLLAESRGLVHPRVARLPQVLAIDVPSPDLGARRHYIEWFTAQSARSSAPAPKLWADEETLARYTAGLSIHALRQLLLGSAHSGEPLSPARVIDKVGEFIQSQLGEDVVEFKKPEHTLEDIVGFSSLKRFIREELLPRFQSSGPDALPGAAVAGPIGGGKTFIFEAAAAALDMPVLVLKNIRSQWFGQTDVIFERLRRVLEALVKVVIFVDEADTQFGGVGPSAHETERRLTGKIQQMMSDPKLRGRVIWLLMTARIHLLSPDIRRPGRVGDLIIPVLDPEGEDRKEFLRWVLAGALEGEPAAADVDSLDALTAGYSSAAFASLRSRLKALSGARQRAGAGGAEARLSFADIEAVVRDHIPPAIEKTRRYQTLQALVNCTRRSLLPDPRVDEAEREAWQKEIRALESEGIG